MILVTGGAGFIGSCLLAALEERGLGPLVVVDWLGHEDKWRNLAKRQLHDILPPDCLYDFLADKKNHPEMIFHMGALSSTTETDGDAILSHNLRYAQRLFSWCTEHAVRLVYASSAATYGDGGLGFEDNDAADALAALRPLNLYGWSKHAFDRYVRTERDSKRPLPPQCVGLKFFNVYGPNEYHKGSQRSVAHQIFPVAQKGDSFALFESDRPDIPHGGQRRDFIFVQDCVNIMLWLLDNPGVQGLFNVGTAQARSFADLAAAVYRACGRAPAISFKAMPEALRGKYQYFTEARMDRLRAAGYTAPMTSLEDGITRYVQDFLLRDDPYC